MDDILYREAVHATLGEVAFRHSLADYDFVTDSGILDQILEDNEILDDGDIIDAVKSCFVDTVDTHIRRNGPFPEIPGAIQAFERLRRSSAHFVAIATGGWRETAVLKLESAGFDLSGVPLSSANDSKDRSEIMRSAISTANSSLQSITYYGDGIWDKKACTELGWNFVAVGPELDGIESYDGLAGT